MVLIAQRYRQYENNNYVRVTSDDCFRLRRSAISGHHMRSAAKLVRIAAGLHIPVDY